MAPTMVDHTLGEVVVEVFLSGQIHLKEVELYRCGLSISRKRKVIVAISSFFQDICCRTCVFEARRLCWCTTSEEKYSYLGAQTQFSVNVFKAHIIYFD